MSEIETGPFEVETSRLASRGASTMRKAVKLSSGPSTLTPSDVAVALASARRLSASACVAPPANLQTVTL
jgi:hypothetical protein